MARTLKPIRVERELIESDAFAQLNAPAMRLLFLFFLRRQMEPVRGRRTEWIIKNNGEIHFSYKDAQRNYGYDSVQFRRAIDMLIECGFLDVREPGAGMNKSQNYFWIDDRWKLYGTSEFIKVKRKKDKRQVGYQGSNKRHATKT